MIWYMDYEQKNSIIKKKRIKAAFYYFNNIKSQIGEYYL